MGDSQAAVVVAPEGGMRGRSEVGARTAGIGSPEVKMTVIIGSFEVGMTVRIGEIAKDVDVDTAENTVLRKIFYATIAVEKVILL